MEQEMACGGLRVITAKNAKARQAELDGLSFTSAMELLEREKKLAEPWWDTPRAILIGGFCIGTVAFVIGMALIVLAQHA